MTDFCQIVSLSRPSGTLGVSLCCHRTAQFWTVLLRFSLIEAVEKSVRIIRAI